MTNNREEQIYKAADNATYQTPPQYSELVRKSRKVMSAYEVGFIDGCVWADSHPNWIPVEEELPPKMDKWTKASDYVLVYTNEGEWLIGRYWHDGDGWSISGFTKAKVTHWMPIVPPRKEE